MPKDPVVTKTVVQNALFDELMQTIDPRLLIANRRALTEMIAKATPKQRDILVEELSTSFAEFAKQWPKFIATITGTWTKDLHDARVRTEGEERTNESSAADSLFAA